MGLTLSIKRGERWHAFCFDRTKSSNASCSFAFAKRGEARASEPLFQMLWQRKTLHSTRLAPGHAHISLSCESTYCKVMRYKAVWLRSVVWGVCICVIYGTETWTTVCVFKPALRDYWSKDGYDIWEKAQCLAFQRPPEVTAETQGPDQCLAPYSKKCNLLLITRHSFQKWY